MAEPLILVHGGAGRIPESIRAAHRDGCLEAARAGGSVLQEGGTAVEAACVAVAVLEDNPRFNAGTGCALDRDGRVSLDAAVMDGAGRLAGAVAVLPAFRNPVRIARLLMEQPAVFLAGEAAARWAEEQGFERLADEELIPAHTREVWEKVVARGLASNWAGGTVGAVARDAAGRLAAATSTGGTMGKLPGRIGDSPVLGAGTFADDFAAVSTTGHGEPFLKMCFAVRLADAVRAGEQPGAALPRLLGELESQFGGEGGAILVTRSGGPVAGRNTPTMSHAWWSPAGAGAAD